jgi:hypothetical protein
LPRLPFAEATKEPMLLSEPIKGKYNGGPVTAIFLAKFGQCWYRLTRWCGTTTLSITIKIATPDITALGIMTGGVMPSVVDADCPVFYNVMLNVIMPSIVAPWCKLRIKKVL